MLFAFVNLRIHHMATIAIGASTSICAIIGLYVAYVIVLHKKGEDIKQGKRQVLTMLLSLLVISLFPGVDLYGHLGSLLSGLFLGMMLLPASDPEVSIIKKIGIVLFVLYTVMLLTLFI